MFSIFSRYILRAHFAPFLFGFITVVLIFLMQFLLNYLDLLVGKGLDTKVILLFIGYNLSWMVVWGMPMGVLFSTLMAFGNLSANFEIAIFKASGASLIKMMIPIMIAGLLLSYCLFVFNDIVLPRSNHKAKTLMSDIKRTRPTFALISGQFSSELNGLTILSRKVDSISGLMQNVTIYDYSKAGTYNIITSDSGRVAFNKDYTKIIMHLFNGEIHQIPSKGLKNYRIVDFKEYQISMEASGYNFSQSGDDPMSRGQRELSIAELSASRDEYLNNSKVNTKNIDKLLNKISQNFKYSIKRDDGILVAGKMQQSITEVKSKFKDSLNAYMNILRQLDFESSGLNSEAYVESQLILKAKEFEVEIQKKYSIPFSCFIFVLIGCPLGIKTKGGNFGLSAAISLGFYVIYWGCLIGGEKLADRGLMSPIMSMWLADIILGTIGLLLILKVNNETFSFTGFFLSIFKIKKEI